MAQLNKYKTLAAMLYLVKRAGGELDYYKLVKMMYIADREHLRRKGHTVTRDFYVRMPHGSTGSKTLEMLQGVKGEHNKDVQLREFASPHFCVEGVKPNFKVIAFSDPDLDELSSSELQALSEAFDLIYPMSFSEARDVAHDEAYNARRPEEAWVITYEEMSGGNAQLIKYLRMMAKNA